MPQLEQPLPRLSEDRGAAGPELHVERLIAGASCLIKCPGNALIMDAWQGVSSAEDFLAELGAALGAAPSAAGCRAAYERFASQMNIRALACGAADADMWRVACAGRTAYVRCVWLPELRLEA